MYQPAWDEENDKYDIGNPSWLDIIKFVLVFTGPLFAILAFCLLWGR